MCFANIELIRAPGTGWMNGGGGGALRNTGSLDATGAVVFGGALLQAVSNNRNSKKLRRDGGIEKNDIDVSRCER
jgi:hypothetical protein